MSETRSTCVEKSIGLELLRHMNLALDFPRAPNKTITYSIKAGCVKLIVLRSSVET
ncbi:MAG: hypothetical protein WCO86_19860 [Planctomycetota bacterium]